ncbi:hypothetical protein GCM10023306_13160 [Novosphingobium ginsenosidimutans]
MLIPALENGGAAGKGVHRIHTFAYAAIRMQFGKPLRKSALRLLDNPQAKLAQLLGFRR